MAEKKSFEVALEELEALVKELESGEIDLSEAVEKYNQGMKLSEYCHTLLKEAESVIVKKMQGEELSDFEK